MAEQPRGDGPTAADPGSLSAFIARVLNQLSLSAWLPGAFFVASVTVLAWFGREGHVTLSGVGDYVQQHWIPFLILAVPALVIATLLTQAFSFAAIQTLEGYWHGRGLASWVSARRIRTQLKRKKSLTDRFYVARVKAFDAARPQVLENVEDGLVFLAVEMDVRQKPRHRDLSDEQHDAADAFDWMPYCDPADAAKLLRLDKERRAFPSDERTMPTKLGNLLRSAEDGLEDRGNLAGFVMRNRHLVPTRILIHHDQFRTRLDMYCVLYFVSLLAAGISIPVLWSPLPTLSALEVIGRVLVTLAFCAMAWACYGAALASGVGYVAALQEMNSAVSESLHAEQAEDKPLAKGRASWGWRNGR
jgi:hypothetical protein